MREGKDEGGESEEKSVQTVAVAMDVKHCRYAVEMPNLLDIVCAIAS